MGRTVPTAPTSKARAPAFTSPRARGSMPARKYCRATASSRTTPSRRRSAIRRSRAKTSTGRSTASRSTRRRTWAAIRSASRCIDSGKPFYEKCPVQTGHFLWLFPGAVARMERSAIRVYLASRWIPGFRFAPSGLRLSARRKRRIVAFAKLLDRLGTKIAQALEDDLIRPVPPGDAAQAFGDRIGKTLADRSRRNAADDRIGRHVAADDGACGNHRSVADRHARQQDGGVANPAIVADDHPVAATLGKEVAVARGRRLVIFRAIGEAMLRRPAHRMVRRADPDRVGDRREFSDHGVGDFAIFPEIGVVAERGIFDAGVAQDFAAPADLRLAQAHRFMDDGFRELGAMRGVHEPAPMKWSDRRVGKGALATCPPSITDHASQWWARSALPTLHSRGNRSASLRAQRSNPFFLRAVRWIASLRSQ